jgi:hypothetical protein
MTEMAHENVRRQDDEKKKLRSPLQHSIRVLAKNTFLATAYIKMVKRSDYLATCFCKNFAFLRLKENANHNS